MEDGSLSLKLDVVSRYEEKENSCRTGADDYMFSSCGADSHTDVNLAVFSTGNWYEYMPLACESDVLPIFTQWVAIKFCDIHRH